MYCIISLEGYNISFAISLFNKNLFLSQPIRRDYTLECKMRVVEVKKTCNSDRKWKFLQWLKWGKGTYPLSFYSKEIYIKTFL